MSNKNNILLLGLLLLISETVVMVAMHFLNIGSNSWLGLLWDVTAVSIVVISVIVLWLRLNFGATLSQLGIVAAKTGAVICIAESGLMLTLHLSDWLPPFWQTAFLDGILFAVMSAPIIYHWAVKPVISEHPSRPLSLPIQMSVVISFAMLMFDLSLPLGVAGGVPYVMLVLVGLWFRKRSAAFVLALVGTLLTVIGYLFSEPGGVYWMVLANRGLAIVAIWITAVLVAKYKVKVDELEKSRNELKARFKDRTKELRESEQRFLDFAFAASDWFWEMGPDLRFSNFSEHASERLGLPSDLLIGKTRREIGQAGSNGEEWEAHLTDLDAHRPFRDFEYEVIHGNFISVSGIPAFDNNGDFLGYRGTGTNITERRKAEQRLSDAIESISEGFVLYDKDDRLVICNSKYREIYKDSTEVIVPGATFEEIIRFGVEHGQYFEARERVEAFIRERMAKHQNPTEAIEQLLSNGKWLRIEEHKTSDGGIVGIRTDITQLKNSEAELIEHRDYLEELVVQRTEEVQEKASQLEAALLREKEYNSLQQKFVALVSHEFRTPLAIIDGAAQRLVRRKNKLDANEVEDRVKKVRSAVTRMVGLIDTTLYASRLDAGKIEMQRTSNDIGDLLLDVCERQAEIAPDHQFNVEVEGLPNKMLIDRRLLDQVFTNLLSNAVKYAPQAPHIEVKGWQENEDAVITITDCGVGIQKDELPYMFGRFFRASTAEGFKGTGLGLSVCKEFIEMHGGTIEVDSVEGQGTTFTVRLPIGGGDQKK